MGFNLKMFFDELLDSLDEIKKLNDAGLEVDIDQLIKEVEFQQKYAEDCGQIRD